MQQPTITLSTYSTAKELCALLKINKSTLHRWEKAGSFPKSIKNGRTKRYLTAEVQAFLAQMQQQETH